MPGVRVTEVRPGTMNALKTAVYRVLAQEPLVVERSGYVVVYLSKWLQESVIREIKHAIVGQLPAGCGCMIAFHDRLTEDDQKILRALGALTYDESALAEVYDKRVTETFALRLGSRE